MQASRSVARLIGESGPQRRPGEAAQARSTRRGTAESTQAERTSQVAASASSSSSVRSTGAASVPSPTAALGPAVSDGITMLRAASVHATSPDSSRASTGTRDAVAEAGEAGEAGEGAAVAAEGVGAVATAHRLSAAARGSSTHGTGREAPAPAASAASCWTGDSYCPPSSCRSSAPSSGAARTEKLET